MGKLTDQLNSLRAVFDDLELEIVEDMILNAADYVRAVVDMEAKDRNFAGRDIADKSKITAEADRHRSLVHNGLIGSVNSVNRCCEAHEQPLIYTGDEKRRHYGDFAFALVQEIFEERK